MRPDSEPSEDPHRADVSTPDIDVGHSRLRSDRMLTTRQLRERTHAPLSPCYADSALGLSGGSGTATVRTHASTTDTTMHGTTDRGTIAGMQDLQAWVTTVTRSRPQYLHRQHRYRAGAGNLSLSRGTGFRHGVAEDRDIAVETVSHGGLSETGLVLQGLSRALIYESGTTGSVMPECIVQALYYRLTAQRCDDDSLSLPASPRRGSLAPKPETAVLSGPDTIGSEPKYIIFEFGGCPGCPGRRRGDPQGSKGQDPTPSPLKLAEPSDGIAGVAC